MAQFTVNRDINAVIGPFTLDAAAGVVVSCPDDLFDEVEDIIEGTPGAVVTFLSWDRATAIEMVLDGGGLEITPGIKADFELPYNGRFIGWRVYGDQTGAIAIDLWKDDFANFPPTVADTITGSEKPTLAAAAKASSDTLADWITTFTQGDILRVNVDSADTVTRATLSLIVIKT